MSVEHQIPVQKSQILSWRSLAIVMLILGTVFRFINLDQKLYWHDEVYTSLRVTAHSEQELIIATLTDAK